MFSWHRFLTTCPQVRRDGEIRQSNLHSQISTIPTVQTHTPHPGTRVINMVCVKEKTCIFFDKIIWSVYLCIYFFFAAAGYQINNSFYSCSGFDSSLSTFEQSMRAAAFSGMYRKTHSLSLFPYSRILTPPPACGRSQTAGVCIQWGFSAQGDDGVQHRGLQVVSL